MDKGKPTKLQNLATHLLFWVAYALYFYVVNVLGNEQVTLGLVMLSLPYFAFVFYSVLYILQRFFAKRRYLPGVLSLLAFYLISSILVWMVTHADWVISGWYSTFRASDYTFSWREFVQTSMLMHNQFSILAVVYFHYREKLEQERQKLAEMEKRWIVEDEKRHLEYTTLAAQVSPHMMANIFQSWSTQLASLTPNISQQMMNVYGLMKFYMQAHEPESSRTILLQDEITAVQGFVAAHREVLGSSAVVEWDIRGNLQRFGIPPTSVLTLVKNAFKHGDVYTQEVPLYILVEADWSRYTVQVTNKKLASGTTLQSHGRGLHNLKRRLHIVFGTRAQFEVIDKDMVYKASIQVDFNM